MKLNKTTSGVVQPLYNKTDFLKEPFHLHMQTKLISIHKRIFIELPIAPSCLTPNESRDDDVNVSVICRLYINESPNIW